MRKKEEGSAGPSLAMAADANRPQGGSQKSGGDRLVEFMQALPNGERKAYKLAPITKTQPGKSAGIARQGLPEVRSVRAGAQ